MVRRGLRGRGLIVVVARLLPKYSPGLLPQSVRAAERLNRVHSFNAQTFIQEIFQSVPVSDKVRIGH